LDLFADRDRERFFNEPWTVSPQSDRVGYRLVGAPLASTPAQILSEPVRVGTIQVPENGLPIVTMRDGPTVGGYPKLGMIDPRDLAWLTQCRPGQSVRFQPLDEP
jgi:antagonist of KipI